MPMTCSLGTTPRSSTPPHYLATIPAFARLQTEVISRLGPDKQLMEIAVDEGRFVQLRFKGHVPQKLPIKVS